MKLKAWDLFDYGMIGCMIVTAPLGWLFRPVVAAAKWFQREYMCAHRKNPDLWTLVEVDEDNLPVYVCRVCGKYDWAGWNSL